MEKYLTKLKEINTDKARNVIKLIEGLSDDASSGAKREALEEAKELIEADRTSNDTRELLRAALKSDSSSEFGPWINDFSDTFVIYEEDGGPFWKADYSIIDNKVTFGIPIKVIQKIIFEPIAEAKKNKKGQYDLFEKSKQEAITGDYIQLIESAISEDGTIPIKIIQPGWGMSGYYPKEVLQRDAGIYKEGTKMYWNHPTASEEIERPERSLNDLAGVLVSEGAYDSEGASGPGIYANAKVFGQYENQLSEMSTHIGLSHIAGGMAKTGEAEGKSGRIIESLNIAESVDFVTEPGAGGEIIQLFESASKKQLPKSNIKMEENKELDRLKESNQSLKDEIKRFKEKEVLSEAKEFVDSKLKESELPDITKTRLLDSLARNPTTDDKGGLDLLKFGESVKKGIDDEISYLAKLSDSGKITGMGGGGDHEADDTLKENMKSITRSFVGLGLEGKELEIAVNGRKIFK